MPDIPKVFDRDAIAQRLRRRPQRVDDFVTALVLADLRERLGAVTRTFKQAAILSPDAGRMPMVARSAEAGIVFERISTVVAQGDVPLVDPEMLDLPRRGYDLIVSIFDLQVVNDVPGFLARARMHLREDGLFLAAAIGGDSLTELRQALLEADEALSGGAFARVAPFIPLREGGGLLQRAGLALPVADVETHTVRYQQPLSLMQDIKAMGAANPLADRPGKMATRGLLLKAAEAYQRIAGQPDGRVSATLEIIWLSGWAPHESQQQPLKPGSAEISLTKVLKG